MSAIVLRSQSDTVLEGAAHLGVRVNLTQPVTISDVASNPEILPVSMKLRVLKAIIYENIVANSVFVIVKYNSREIYRTPTRYSARAPTWINETSSARIQLFCLRSSIRPQTVSVELWGADEYSAKRHYLGEVVLTSADFLNVSLQDQECEYKLAWKSQELPLRVSGKVILRWSLIPSTSINNNQGSILAETALCAFHGADSLGNGHLGDNGNLPVCVFPYTIYIANINQNPTNFPQ